MAVLKDLIQIENAKCVNVNTCKMWKHQSTFN